MSSKNDPYDILGIRPGASQEEIKRAYKEQAKKYHPDKYADNPLQELADDKMRKINAAYDELSKRGSAGSSSHSSGYNSGYGGNSYSPNYGQQNRNAYAYSAHGGGNGSTYGNMKKWPRYYYIILAVILILFSFGGSFLNNLLGSNSTVEDPYGSAYGSGEEYGYPQEGQSEGEYPAEEEYGGENSENGGSTVSDPVIAYIMSGTLSDYPDVTISDAVSSYLSDVSWQHGQDSSGQSVIEASGYTGSEPSNILKMHFTYDQSGNIYLEWIGDDYSDTITTAQLENYKAEIFGSGSAANGADT